MEFTNEIFFNKPLTVDNTVIITYCGKLYREHSKDVSIVYGYGDNWDYTESSPMIETDNGFEATITIKDYNTFNFCFTNSFNIWDNNSGFNYIAPISPKQIEQVSHAEELEQNISLTENSICKDDNETITDSLSKDIIDNTPSVSIENSQEIEEPDKENNQEINKNSDDTIEDLQNSKIEAAFASLLDSLLDDIQSNNESIDISNLPGFGLQSVGEIEEEEMINCDKIFEEFFEELTLEVEPKQENISQEENSIKSKNSEVANYNDIQELDNLMDNLLMSISDQPEISECATPIQQVESQDLSQENIGLPAVQIEEDWVDKIINVSYSFAKKITTACKKFGSLIKLKAKEFGIINEK